MISSQLSLKNLVLVYHLLILGTFNVSHVWSYRQQWFQSCKFLDNPRMFKTLGVLNRSLHCAIKCMDDEPCFGYQFTSSRVCKVSQCLNPNLLVSEDDDEGEDNFSADSYLSLSASVVNTSLALKKPSESSSTNGGHAASNGNNGLYIPDSTDSEAMAHTQSEDKPCWRVDLMEMFCVWGVKILNRSQRKWQRTKNMIVTVSDDVTNIFWLEGKEDNFCNYYDGILNQYYTLITCRQAIRGQFVQIQLNVTNIVLNFYELEVHGV